MKILSIEPTPSPNSMKLNMDFSLPNGKKYNFTKEQSAGAPEYIRQLLAIQGVKSVYQVADFIALDRFPKADWQEILSTARKVFGEASSGAISEAIQSDAPLQEAFGEVNVFVQMFRGLPMQVKLTTATEQTRVGLPERFLQAAMKAEASSTNLVMERKWVEQGVRYGSFKEIGEEVAAELAAAYDQQRLDELVEAAFAQNETAAEAKSQSSTAPEIRLEDLSHPDWKVRYAALEKMKPTEQELPYLVKLLDDENQSIRRLATVYLGMIGGKEVLPPLFHALKDKSVSVRRTAGDTLSDLGDPDAIEPMAEALKDKNPLVRWRAARFLYEVGDETALEALRAAQDDSEFEVSLQVKIALERIEGGEAASGTVWQQMTRSLSEKDAE